MIIHCAFTELYDFSAVKAQWKLKEQTQSKRNHQLKRR
jgi:hypothetical protein